jgi:prefoldin subunit 5
MAKTTKEKRTKSKIVLTPEEAKLVEEHRKYREQIATLREKMRTIEQRIAPLATKRVALQKLRASGLNEKELKAIADK